jgi:hypothetical protein
VLDHVIMKQPLTIERVLNAFELGQRVGIDMHAFYIIGFPRESLAQIHTTLRFALDGLRRWDVMPHLAIARADPGTALFAEATASGTLVTDHAIATLGPIGIDQFVRHHIQTDEFTPELLGQLSDGFYRRMVAIVLGKTAAYVARHPLIGARAAAAFLGYLVRDRLPFRDAVVRLFFCRLFYRYALPRQREFERPAPAPAPPEASQRPRAMQTA